VEYNTDLFDRSTVDRMVRQYLTILGEAVKNENTPISRLQWLTTQERHQQLFEWNDTSTDRLRVRCMHELFEEQVQRTPDVNAGSV